MESEPAAATATATPLPAPQVVSSLDSTPTPLPPPPNSIIPVTVTVIRSDLTCTEKKDIYAQLLLEIRKNSKEYRTKSKNKNNGGNVLPHGALSKVATQFGRSRTTVSKLWKSIALARNKSIGGSSSIGTISHAIDTALLPIFKNKRFQRTYVTKYTKDECIERIRALPLSQRTSLRQVASNSGIPRTSLRRMIKSHPSIDSSPCHPHSSQQHSDKYYYFAGAEEETETSETTGRRRRSGAYR